MYIDEQEVFAAAIEIENQADRADYLSAACGECDGLRQRIEQLIAAHRHHDGLLDNELDIATGQIDCGDLPLGTEIGQYKILETLGEGGFGVVYRAGQREPLRRDVALKIIKPGVQSQQIVKRFETELQTLGRMEHPHIAQVFDAGSTDDGQPYFVMELVQGTPITEYCRLHDLTVDQRLQLFVGVCRAIQHAHEKGVIHRDIKPSNVLVTQKDGAPFPKIIDFGIATVVAESDEYESNQAHWIGTPAYMSPEEIESGNEQIGVRTDVYGLGLLLYELLSDRNPHWNESEEGVSISEIRRRIVEETVQPPSRSAPAGANVPRDLDCITLKCLDRQPSQRYDSALSLTRDVERFRHHETVRAHPTSTAYCMLKFARRNRTSLIMWAATTAIIAAILLPTIVSRQRRALARQRNSAVNRQRIEKSLDEASRLHEQALATGSSDLESITQAIAAVRHAEQLLEIGTHDEALHARVSGYLSRLLVEHKDRSFLSTIERAQIHFVDPDDPFGQQRTRTLLNRAFNAIDIEVGTTPPSVAAELIATRSPEVQGYAIAAIDIWAVLYCQDTPQTHSWLRNVAHIADSDTWRSTLRTALDNGDTNVLEQLAVSEQLDEQSTSSLILLVHALRRTRNQHFVTTLQRAADAYPNVLYFNLELGMYYSTRARDNNAEATQKAIHYLSAALALRPNDHRILSNLSMNLSRAGNHSRAANLLRRAVESQKDFWIGWHNLGLTLARQGDYSSAIDAHRSALLCIDNVGSQQIAPMLHRSVAGLRLAICMVHYQSTFTDPVWNYTVTQPADWPMTSDAADWQTGHGRFGTPFFSPHTPWMSPELWLQKTFTVAGSLDAVLALRAVARVQVHVDGRPVATREFKQDDPRMIRLPHLARGHHTLAIHASSLGRERCLHANVMVGDIAVVDAELKSEINAVCHHFTEATAGDPERAQRQRQIVRVLTTLSAE